MNNFDQSTSGVNLTLNCFYDKDRSQSDFDESFHVLQYAGFRQNSVLVFNQFGNFDFSDFELTDLDNYDLSDCTVKSIFKDYYNFKYPTNIDEDLKATDYTGVKELIMYLDINFNDLDVNGLLEAIETDLYCDTDFAKFLSDNYNKNYITLESRGYSQGDYSEIILTKELIDHYIENFEELATADQAAKFLQSTIDHLIWDAPLYARLEIETDQDEQEFYFDEYLTDFYNYDKDQLVQIFNDNYTGDHKVYISEWLTDNLPDHADYK